MAAIDPRLVESELLELLGTLKAEYDYIQALSEVVDTEGPAGVHILALLDVRWRGLEHIARALDFLAPPELMEACHA